MSVVGRILDSLRAVRGRGPAVPRVRAVSGGISLSSRANRMQVRARYDAAQTTSDNARHWAMADSLSANAAASPQVRRILRSRARYEVANNSYAKGIVLTLANDTIGTGPRLQLTAINGAAARQVEQAFMTWAAAVDLAEKLRVMRMAQVEDGEAFALFTTNPQLASSVQLDIRLMEADQIATPWGMIGLTDQSLGGPNFVDGILFDAAGNPSVYHVLDRHPGDLGWPLSLARPVSAEAVLHAFRADRPGQRRGIPELTPALPLFAQLRRYTLAVIAAAETAADYAGIVYTDAPAGGEADSVEPMDTIALEKRALLTMPGGWKMEQMRAEQPTTTYADFKHEILNEIARCLNMPFNVAAGNSSSYNYASGRLDHQVYFKAIRVDQSRLGRQILDRIFAAWLQEALLLDGVLPDAVRSEATDWSHQWFWDGHEHVDPGKEASAQATRLANHTTTLADEYARKGQDWEAQLRQRSREMALMRELNLEAPDAGGPSPAPATPGNPATPPKEPAEPTEAPNPDAGDDIDARAA